MNFLLFRPHIVVFESFALFLKWPMDMVVLTFLNYLCLGNNGFQPLDTLTTLFNFTSSGSHGINEGAEIRQLLAQISVLEWDLAVQKCAAFFFCAYMR